MAAWHPWRVLLALAALSLGACTPGGPSDEEKLARLDQLCIQEASEQILDDSADGIAQLSGGYMAGALYLGWTETVRGFVDVNAPLGAKKLPILDMEYSGYYLLQNLFAGYDPMREVHFSRDAAPPSATAVRQECRNMHVVSVKSAAESEQTFLGVCDPARVLPPLSNARYAIGLAYGELDRHEIRPFIFYVRDRASGRTLAEQRSFQLLMGGMSSDHRILRGMGSAQGVRNCPLTPPDQLVKRVFRAAPPAGGQAASRTSS